MAIRPWHGVLVVAAACTPANSSIYLGPPGTAETHAVVEVRKGAVLPEVWRLRSRVDVDGSRQGDGLLPESPPSQPLSFPTTYAVVVPGGSGTLNVQVDALDRDGFPVGRVRGTVTLVSQGAAYLSLDLAVACVAAADCQDGTWCNGPERCLEGICAGAQQVPCPPSAFACVQQRCVEEARQCDVRVDHGACQPLLNPDGTQEPTYCDPVSGCVRGQPCQADPDCADSFVCNGVERCVSGRCMGGVPPSVEDANPCTVDSCGEPGGALHTPGPDGNKCPLLEAEDGICLTGRCVDSACGDGYLDLLRGEACDDGERNSDTLPDACRRDCHPARCGDGVTDGPEGCDHGGTPTVHCLVTCQVNRCGDGVVEAPREACDDGNAVETDACRRDCTAARCGDGVVQAGVEECDDGNDLDTDACLTTCRLNTCGDGVLLLGVEECDDGNALETDACLTTCHLNTCGDGFVLTGVEECDDGNSVDTDACRKDCTAARCGDGVVQAGVEECDDGNALDTDACLGNCRRNTCGDGFLLLGEEECDDGNASDADACLVTCRLNTCGDGYVNPAQEQCDDGNASNQDGCLVTCVLNVCGDGFQYVGVEACDDGNPVDTDFCRTTCVPAACGDGVVNPATEVCDDGNTRSGDGCRFDCRKVETCGDRVVDTGEACDDGNDNPNDGCDHCHRTRWDATLLAGYGPPAGDPLLVPLTAPMGLAVDRLGGVYVSDNVGDRVWRVDTATSTAVAAAGTGFIGDACTSMPGRMAVAAALSAPAGMALDLAGNLVLAVQDIACLITVDSSGAILAKTVRAPATLVNPVGVAVDSRQRTCFSEPARHKVFRADDGVVMGTGTAGFSGDGGPATAAMMRNPTGLAADWAGNLFIADRGNHRVRKVDPAGIITTVAGTGVAGADGAGGPAVDAQLNDPAFLAVDGSGRLLVTETAGARVLRLEVDGTLTVLAGSGVTGSAADGTPATEAALAGPSGVAVGPGQRIYFAESTGGRVRYLDAQGRLATLAGAPAGTLDRMLPREGKPALSMNAVDVSGVALAPDGTLYFTDYVANRVRRVGSDRRVFPFAGAGPYGVGAYAGDNGPALQARLNQPTAVLVARDGRVLVADQGNHAVRQVSPGGVITTLAGSGVEGNSGDGNPATQAQVGRLRALAEDSQGNIYLLDEQFSVVRKVAPDGSISTVAGTGTAGFSGDDGPAVQAQLSGPWGVATDAEDNVYIADLGNGRVRRVDPSGTMTTVAGGGGGGTGDNGPATAATLNGPVAVAVTPDGALWIAEFWGNTIRRVGPDGIITTEVGTGIDGDGAFYQDARLIRLRSPFQLAVTPQGELAFLDQELQDIRVLRGGVTEPLVANVLVGDGALEWADVYMPQRVLPAQDGLPWLWTERSFGTLRATRGPGTNLQTVMGHLGGRTVGATAEPAWQTSMSSGDVASLAYSAEDRVLWVSVGQRIFAVQVTDPAAPELWTVTLYSGGTYAGYQDGPVQGALYRAGMGLHWDGPRRRLLVADPKNYCVRAVDVDQGVVTTVAGIPGVAGGSDVPGPALRSLVGNAADVAVAANGAFYISSGSSNRVFMVTPDGDLERILGDGSPAANGDGAPARLFGVRNPQQLEVDPFGNLWVTSQSTVRVITAGEDGVATGDDAVLTVLGQPPRDSFPGALLGCASGLGLAAAGDEAWITDECRSWVIRMRRVQVP